MTVPATSDPLDFSSDEYNHVARTARLSGIRLLKFSMEANPEAWSRDRTQKLSYGREVVSCGLDEEGPAVAAIFRYTVTAKAGRSRSFLCQADYAVVYDMPEDAVREAALAFCKHVGPFACYPYFRAAVSQMAWGSGTDLPPLPSIAAMPVVPKRDRTGGAASGE